MIVANLATYPPRLGTLPEVIASIIPQVDQLNIVLNEFDSVPDWLEKTPKVRAIIPAQDTKDTGKFLPDTSEADYVFLIDDDIVYPPDYVRETLRRFQDLGPGVAASYHGSLYGVRRSLKLNARSLKRAFRAVVLGNWHETRKVFPFHKGLSEPVVVDQIASGVAVLRGSDMPPFAFMESSQKFVDVRLSLWCFRQKLSPVVLARRSGWLIPIRYDETIYHDYTLSNPTEPAKEILQYAFKVPGRGKPPGRIQPK